MSESVESGQWLTSGTSIVWRASPGRDPARGGDPGEAGEPAGPRAERGAESLDNARPAAYATPLERMIYHIT